MKSILLSRYRGKSMNKDKSNNTEFKVTVTLLSPLQLSGGQAVVNVDVDMLVDSMGIPYIPAKRFRGVLYESALEVIEMVETTEDGHGHKVLNRNVLDELFNRGDEESNVVLEIEDLYIKGYDSLKEELELLHKAFPSVVTKKSIRNAYTTLRYETAIDETTGVVKDGSLRTIRVMDREDQVFEGHITIHNDNETENEIYKHLLVVALQNTKNIGYKRNRGFGRIQCTMGIDIDAQKVLVDEVLNKK